MIDIIIPVFNNWKYTKKCIDSVIKNTKDYNLIVIDNGSSDDTATELKKLDVKVITNKANLGFVKAINQGLLNTKNDVVLLNNDTEVSKRWLEKIKKTKGDLIGVKSSVEMQNNLPFISFFCVFIKRKVVDDVGYLDENIEVGLGDDLDYCIRALKAGYTLNKADVLVQHNHRTTISKVDNIDFIGQKNHNYVLNKHKKKIYVAVLNQGNIRADLNLVLMRMMQDGRHSLKITYPSLKDIAHNRNQIVKDFLKSGYDYLLMLDDDTVPQHNILDLVYLDKDIIGVPYPQWNEGDIYWVVMDKVEDGYKAIPIKERGGLKKVDALGTGCILIARRVLEEIKAPFMRKWSDEGLAEIGLDFYFCDKAREKGFEVWCHWNYPCEHYKNIGLMQVLKLINKS